jgi:hypothetical protein
MRFTAVAAAGAAALLALAAAAAPGKMKEFSMSRQLMADSCQLFFFISRSQIA